MSRQFGPAAARVALLSVFAVSLSYCDAGLSCQGCAPTDYDYPSHLVQGVEPVDDGMRARLTERGLDFIVGHLDSIITQSFPPLSTDPNSPDSRRAAIPFANFASLAWDSAGTVGGTFDWTAGLSLTDVDPSSYAYIILEDENGRTLRDKITADFVEPAAVHLHIEDLRIGLQATALGEANMQFSDPDWAIAACAANYGIASPLDTTLLCLTCDQAGWPDSDYATCVLAYGGDLSAPANCCRNMDKLSNVDIGCDLVDGIPATNPIYPGHAISLSLDVIIRPSVTNQNCNDGAEACLAIDAVFDPVNDVSIGDINVDVINSTYQDLCTDDDHILGQFLTVQGVTGSPSFECDAVCPVLDGAMGAVEGALDLLGPIVDVAAGGMVNGLLNGMLDSLNGLPLQSEGRISLAAIGGGAVDSLNAANDLGYVVRPTTGTFGVNCPAGTASCEERRGMDMNLASGFEAVDEPDLAQPAPNACVRAISGMDFVALYQQPAFEAPDALALTGEFTPLGASSSQVYDVAGSLALAAMNQVGFAAYNSGLLCLELGAEDVHALTDGSFVLTAGLVDLLSGGDLSQFLDPRSPALVAIAPELPPIFSLGSGEGGESMINLRVDRLHISMYVLMYERMVRLFEVVADTSAGLNIVPNPQTRELDFVINDGPKVEDYDELYNELLPQADFSTLLPSLIDLAFGSMLADNIHFSYDFGAVLQDSLGVPVAISVDGIETVAVDGQRDFLNVYLSLADAPAGGPLGYTVLSELQVAQDPGLMRYDAAGQLVPSAEVHLVGQYAPVDDRDEYIYRVDNGAWRGFVRADDDSVLHLSSPLLGLPGAHRVEVRGRRIDAPETLEQVPQVLNLIFDPERPRVELRQNDQGGLIARAFDAVTAPEDLEFAFALADREWSEFSPRAQLDAQDLQGVNFVQVKARDEAGNVSPIAKWQRSGVMLPQGADDSTSGPAATLGGCAAVHPQLSWLSLIAMLLMIARRRRQGAQ